MFIKGQVPFQCEFSILSNYVSAKIFAYNGQLSLRPLRVAGLAFLLPSVKNSTITLGEKKGSIFENFLSIQYPCCTQAVICFLGCCCNIILLGGGRRGVFASDFAEKR